jgi:hypothetical protein
MQDRSPGGLPIRAFSSQGPLDGKEIMRSNKGVVLRGTESLLTHRWRELDSNFQFRAKGNVQGFVRDGSDRPSVRQYHRTSCLPGQTIEMSGSESTSRRLRLPLSAPGPGVRIPLAPAASPERTCSGVHPIDVHPGPPCRASRAAPSAYKSRTETPR